MPASIIQDHLVDNLSAIDASPAKKILVRTVEFFKGHHPFTSGTVHLSLLKIFRFAFNLTKGSKKWNGANIVFCWEK
jgi:hypothetical protein